MSYFVVVPGALVPASIAPPLLARAKLPLLAQRLQRAGVGAAERLAGDGAAHLSWLWRRFGGDGDTPITAPYAWRALNRASAIEVPSEQPLWHADPIHFAFARDHMLVTGLDAEEAVSADESRELAAEAAAIASSYEATLRVFDTAHWFLSFDPPWSIKTVGYDAALGRSAQAVLPTGAAAARWRKLLTEVQMTWHQHPLNERREAAGVRTVNGLWLHGGGLWKALPRQPFEVVATNDAIIGGWALASGIAPSALLDGENKPAGGTSSLVYWPNLLQASAHEDWDRWLEALARFESWMVSQLDHAFGHGFGEVALVFAGREVVRVVQLRTSDFWRFWRRNSIAEVFSEPEPA